MVLPKPFNKVPECYMKARAHLLVLKLNMNEVLPGTSQTNTGYMKKKCLELLSLTFRS